MLTLAALFAVTVLVVMRPSAASPATERRFTADEIRWYLEGFVDGASPAGWAAVDGRCVTGSRAFVCLIVARNGAAEMCWRSVLTFTGRFLVPLTAGACPRKFRGPTS